MFIVKQNNAKSHLCQLENEFALKNPFPYALAMGFPEKLKAAMSRKHLNAYELEELSGVSQPTINRICNGKQPDPRIETVQSLAYGLKMTVGELVDGGGVEDNQGSYIVNGVKKYYPRVVGTARCGDEGYYLDLEGGDGYIEFDAAPGAVAIRIKGHSMHPAIREGWFVIIEPHKQPDLGEYVLVKFKDGRKMVKELLQIKPDSYLLLSVNGNERLTAGFEELEGIQAISAIVPPSKHKDW